MRTPGFWASRNLVSAVLLPLSCLYAGAGALRRAVTIPARMPVPVICVGNATTGGAGKTPVALYIGKRLKEKNIRAFFLSRGYGGALAGPVLVDGKIHTARDVGDEPLLLAETLPTVVAKDRRAGGRFAAAQGAQVIVMDDGLQNPSLEKTVSLLVVDGAFGFGNGRLIPAGPLREPVAASLSRAQAVIVVGQSPSLIIPGNAGIVLQGALSPTSDQKLAGQAVVAFSGIAHPEKFLQTLRDLGAVIVASRAYGDHYFYGEADLRQLAALAKQHRAQLVTTTKDAVRLPVSFKHEVRVVPVEITLDKPDILDSLLDQAMRIA